MKSRAEIEIDFADEKKAEAALAAMKHEQDFKKRSSSKLIRERNKLRIIVDSSDLVSLRASINSYMRDLQVMEGIEDKE